jgi:hypothetical protein
VAKNSHSYKRVSIRLTFESFDYGRGEAHPRGRYDVRAAALRRKIRRQFLLSDTTYGLSSAVLTNNLQIAMRFALELEARMVHLNGPTDPDEATVPFGGVKDFGMGREGGRWSIEEMTEVRWVTIQRGKRPYPF